MYNAGVGRSFESSPYLDEPSHLNELADAAADTFDLLKDADHTQQDLWQAYERLEKTLLETAGNSHKIPGEDEAFQAYLELTGRLGIEEIDLKVYLDNKGHLQPKLIGSGGPEGN